MSFLSYKRPVIVLALTSWLLAMPCAAQPSGRNVSSNDSQENQVMIAQQNEIRSDPESHTSAVTADFLMVIETDVFAGHRESVPTESHVTIFMSDKIYDIRTHPDQLTIVFDRTSRRFHIGRRTPQMQTSLTADDLIRFSATLQSKAVESADPIIRFAANPKFETRFDPDEQQLSLTSKVWDYQVDVRSIDQPEVLKRYREFSDWFSYLNAMFRPIPPGARLELNQVLDQHRVIPDQVRVTVRSRGRRIEQCSRHRLSSSLTEAQQVLLDQWQSDQQTIPIVDFSTFQRASTAVAAR